MLRLTYIPDSDHNVALLLCDSSRSLPQMNVRFQHRRMNSIENLALALGGGQAALAQDFGNFRNTLSLTVRRGVDFAGAAFADDGAALAFALDQPAKFPTTGVLKIELGNASLTRWLTNVAIEGLALTDWLGVAPAFDYTFNGGLITNTQPY